MSARGLGSPLRSHRQTRWRFSVEQFVGANDAGILPPEPNTELIDGAIFIECPEGPLHASARAVLVKRLMLELAQERCVVWPHNPIRIGGFSLLQPDVALLRPEPSMYCHRWPDATDLLLAVEIADASLAHDRRRKLALYARHGVPEVWLVSLPEQRLEVHRDPHGRRYRDVTVLGDGDRVAPLCAPDVAVEVGEVLRVRFREGGEKAI